MKKKMIVEIEEMVENIIYATNNGFKRSSSLVFNGIQRPRFYNGYVVEVDPNGMVAFDFDDSLGTSDWLPMSIIDDKIIKAIHDSVSHIMKEVCELSSIKAKDVHILRYSNDSDNGVIGVYNDFYLCKAKLDGIVKEFEEEYAIHHKYATNTSFHARLEDGSDFYYEIESYDFVKK